jgi:hypothetical protein
MTAPERRAAAPPAYAPHSDGEAPLRRLAEIAAELGAERLRATIDAFRERVREGRFYLACVGEFKRGKSTLLNALVGEPVLPMGIVPVTTVPTVVQYGAEPAARVRFANGTAADLPLDAVEGYVSEAQNPRNARGVEVVELFLPSPVLRNGLCLVDTPGLGSVFQENAAATRAFVPQIDAALVVIGADPPLSGEELQLITDAAKHVHHRIIVLNKADRFTAVERREAMRFAESVLAHALGQSAGPILEVSATERLTGHGPERDWPRLLETLDLLALQSGHGLVRAALERGIVRLARQCEREIIEASRALFRPVEESDRRVEDLQIQIGRVAHESLRLGFRMESAGEDTARDAAARRRDFLHHVVPQATAELTQVLDRTTIRSGPTRRRYAFGLARDLAVRHLAPWLAEERRTAEERYRQMTEQFVEDARALLARSPELAALELGDLAAELEPVESIRVASRLDDADLAAPTPPAPPLWRRCLEWVAPVPRVRAAVDRDARDYLEHLLTTGARAVELDFAHRIGESEQRVKHSVHTVLETAYEAADRAVARARAVRARGAEAYDREVKRLVALRHEVAALRAAPEREVSQRARRE